MTRALLFLLLTACSPERVPHADDPPAPAVDACADGARPEWMGDDAKACRWMATLEKEFGKELEGKTR